MKKNCYGANRYFNYLSQFHKSITRNKIRILILS